MKAYIQFITSTNDYNDSPILELETPSRPRLAQLTTTFKSTSPDPAKTMIDFIIFATTSGDRAVAIHDSDMISPDNRVQLHARVPNVVEFVYKKDDGKTDWRKIDILEEDKYYVKGHDINDNNSFKCFKRANIVGGKIIKV
jgi:hypothetical protein